MCSKRDENFTSLCQLIIKSAQTIALCPFALKNGEFVCTRKEVLRTRAMIIILILITLVVIIIDEFNYILKDLSTFLQFLDNYTSLAVVCYALIANYNFHLVINVIERFKRLNSVSYDHGKSRIMHYLFITLIYMLPLCHFTTTVLTSSNPMFYIKCIIACIYYILYGHLISLLFLFKWMSKRCHECVLKSLEEARLTVEATKRYVIELNEIERIWGNFFQGFVLLTFATAYIRLITTIFLYILFHNEYDLMKHVANVLTITMHSGAAIALILQLTFNIKDIRMAARYENYLKKDYNKQINKGGLFYLHVQFERNSQKMILPKTKNILLSVIGSMFVNILILLQFHKLNHNYNFSFKT